MPHPRSPLPKLPETFTTRDAIAAGATPSALRHKSLRAPFPGVRSTHEPEQGEFLQSRVFSSARDFAPRLRPGEAVSHTSALLLYSCPIRANERLHISATPPHNRSRVRGVHGHRLLDTARTTVGLVSGVPTVDPTTALEQSATELPLLELVVALDHLRRPRGHQGSRPPLTTHQGLDRRASEFHGPGALSLRRAITLSAAGAESRMETLTRLLFVAFGLDAYFQSQVELSDDQGWIGRFDFVSRGRKIIVEYDGEQHRTNRSQYAKDQRRLERARAAGFTVIRLLFEDVVLTPHATARRIAAALGATITQHKLTSLLLARG